MTVLTTVRSAFVTTVIVRPSLIRGASTISTITVPGTSNPDDRVHTLRQGAVQSSLAVHVRLPVAS